MRRLIINADDFGLTRGVNRSIHECHNAGVVSSATLMADSLRFSEAVSIAQTSPKLGVGCHIMLVDGAPISQPSTISSLLAPDSQRFRDTASDFARAALQRKLSPDEIYIEATAQIKRLQSAGVNVTHFDTHKHTHMFPVVLRSLIRAAKNCGVTALRNPFSPLSLIGAANFARQPSLWLRYMQVKILDRYSANFREEVANAGMRTTDGAFGVIATGHLTFKRFSAIVRGIPEGTWELVCHPGHDDPDLRSVRTRLRNSREIEHRIFTSPDAKVILAKHDIELINFSGI